MRARRHQQCGAVRVGAYQFVDGKGAAGAGLALDQDRLADPLAELLANDAGDHIDAAMMGQPPMQMRCDIAVTVTPNSTKKLVISGLQPGTTYYWKIVSKTMANKSASGPVWSFGT